METGYSTWALIVADEGSQTRWINESLAALLPIIRDHNLEHDSKILFGNYYQLIDVEGALVPQEANFGILRSDLSHKEGYSSLRTILSQF